MKSILIIEHNPEVASSMTGKLENLGYRVKTAGDEITLAKAEEAAPDVILLDVMMPGLNALKFLQELKESPLRGVPVIITSLVGGKLKEDSLRLGAIDFFRKPLNFEKLDAKLKKVSSRKTILVVDDDPMILRLLEARLGSMGYEVITAPDGETALETAEARVPDIILVDVVLPDMDGLEVINRLKEDESPVAGIPVIAFTGRVSLDGMEGVLGIDKFVGQSFSADDLVSEVDGFLKGSPEGG